MWKEEERRSDFLLLIKTDFPIDLSFLLLLLLLLILFPRVFELCDFGGGEEGRRDQSSSSSSPPHLLLGYCKLEKVQERIHCRPCCRQCSFRSVSLHLLTIFCSHAIVVITVHILVQVLVRVNLHTTARGLCCSCFLPLPRLVVLIAVGLEGRGGRRGGGGERGGGRLREIGSGEGESHACQ